MFLDCSIQLLTEKSCFLDQTIIIERHLQASEHEKMKINVEDGEPSQTKYFKGGIYTIPRRCTCAVMQCYATAKVCNTILKLHLL